MTSRSPYIACKGLNASKNITHQSSKIFPTIILKVALKSCVQFSACIESLGMESGTITDGQITASSELSSDQIASFARLNRVKEGHRGGSWSAKTNDVNQWLQIELGSEYTNVTRIATQGRSDLDQWVETYKLQYSDDGVNYQYYREQGATEDKVVYNFSLRITG